MKHSSVFFFDQSINLLLIIFVYFGTLLNFHIFSASVGGSDASMSSSSESEEEEEGGSDSSDADTVIVMVKNNEQ